MGTGRNTDLRPEWTRNRSRKVERVKGHYLVDVTSSPTLTHTGRYVLSYTHPHRTLPGVGQRSTKSRLSFQKKRTLSRRLDGVLLGSTGSVHPVPRSKSVVEDPHGRRDDCGSSGNPVSHFVGVCGSGGPVYTRGGGESFDSSGEEEGRTVPGSSTNGRMCEFPVSYTTHSTNVVDNRGRRNPF